MSKKNQSSKIPVAVALLSALLFGASTPATKLLAVGMNPQMLAGVLYLGSGLGLSCLYFLTRFAKGERGLDLRITTSDLPALAGIVLFGGISAPILLMVGLRTSSAESASLLLNMEFVFTALIAWFFFKENLDRRIVFGMIAIVIGSLTLSWQPSAAIVVTGGTLAILGCCLCWALDNNLTCKLSDADPLKIAAIKGVVAGTVNCAIGLLSGAQVPNAAQIAQASITGFVGYGLSLVLFILALRRLGTARTGAYFSTAPFVGAAISILIFHDDVTVKTVLASAFMVFGVWLHLTERHEHEHHHFDEEHEHLHRHDLHHQHDHPEGIAVTEPHIHKHRHSAMTHSHPHYPDTDHRHSH